MSYSPYGFSDLSTLPHDLEEQIQAELEPGEKLIWVGQPRPGRLMAAALPTFLFGLLFTAFSVFWLYGASGGFGPPRGRRMPMGGLFALFGLPFVFVGLGMVATPFIAGRNARKTCYALTNRRAILWEATLLSGVRVRSYRPDQLQSLARHQRGDGSGDLIFEEVTTFSNQGRRQVLARGFQAIEDVRNVEALLRTTLLEG